MGRPLPFVARGYCQQQSWMCLSNSSDSLPSCRQSRSFLLSLLGFFYEVWIAPDFVDTSNSDLSEILSPRGGSLWGATDVTTKRDAQNRFKSKFK